MRDIAAKLRKRFLVGYNVLCLGAFLALSDFQCDFLSFSQGFKSISLDCTSMNEYIRSALRRDETKTFVIIEPFNGTGNSLSRHNYLIVKSAGRIRQVLKTYIRDRHVKCMV
jgi:hypothetical protein